MATFSISSNELTKFVLRAGYSQLFVEGINEAYNNQHRAIKEERDLLVKQISDLNRKIDNARELMLLGDLESAEYRKVKEEHGSTIARLEMRFSEITVQKLNSINIKKLAQDAVSTLLELDKLYDLASVPAKRYLVGLLFPEKLSYSDGTCRTPRLNRAAELIYMENNELRAKKKGQKPLKKSLPHKGWKDMLLSSDFLYDLGMLAKLRQRMTEIDPQLANMNLMK